MSLYYGTVTPPTQFAIGVLTLLGRPVFPERNEKTPLPCYVVNGITGTSDNYFLDAIVSVHTFAAGNTPQEGFAICDQWAWDAHYVITRLTPGDVVTLPDGTTAHCAVSTNGLGPRCDQMPAFQSYRDPFIVRYYARYCIPFRFS
jgi:hypothetical protein